MTIPWAVEVVEVHKRPLLEGVSFGVAARGITAVVDPWKGPGSLLFRLIAGLEGVDEGAVIVFGEDMSRSGAADRRRLQRRIGFVFGPPDYALFANATARDNISTFVRTAGRAGRRTTARIVEDALRAVELDSAGDARPEDLTLEGRKRLALARALALQSPFLVIDGFDEQADPEEAAALAAVLREDRAHRGAGALLFMGDAGLAAEIADEVIEL